MFCSKCGAETLDESSFCSRCGAPLRAASSPGIRDAEAQAATRTCEWCAESIPREALRCPRCHKWRKDIDRERVLMYVWAFALFIPLFFFLIGLSRGWWVTRTGPFGMAEEFSFSAFVGSGSGLAILASAIIISGISFYYYAKVSVKIGSWWWL